MFSANTYEQRRNELCRKISKGLILLPGNQNAPNNYPNNAYYFRQDSTFRYYFGLNVPGITGLLDAETGEAALYGDDFTVEDIIWTGPQPTLREMGAEVGIARTFPVGALRAARAELEHRASLCGAADAAGLRGNQALVVDLQQQVRLHKLRLNGRGAHRDERLTREHGRALRHGPDVAGEAEVFQIVQKCLAEQLPAAQIGNVIVLSLIHI
mgnify:CR=1 FL=1